MECGYLTDIGVARKKNEDSLLVNKPLKLFAVADGMGGYQAGELASSIVVCTINDYITAGHNQQQVDENWQKDIVIKPEAKYNKPFGYSNEEDCTITEEQSDSDFISKQDKRKVLCQAILTANDRILSQAATDDQYKNMGSTVTAAYFDKAERHMVLAQVGDSRAYLWRNDVLIQLTKDHSFVGEMLDSGEITEDEAVHHPKRNLITRAVGVETQLAVDCYEYDIDIGDVIILCSDGLYSGMTNAQVAEMIKRNIKPDLQESARDILQQVLQGGSNDNVTIIIMRIN